MQAGPAVRPLYTRPTTRCLPPQVLELLMQADCHVGLQQNFVGMSAFHSALYHSKWSALRQLYQARPPTRLLARSIYLLGACLLGGAAAALPGAVTPTV